MMKDRTAWIATLLVLLAGLLPQAVFAAGYRQPQTFGMEAQQEDPRKQQLQEQARAAAQKMDEILRNVYNAINQQEEPARSEMEFAGQLLEAARRCVVEFTDLEKAKYFLLQGWVDYQNEDLAGAVMNSGRACRLDETNRDAWVSHQYFSILENQRPFRPKPPRNDPFNNNAAAVVTQSLYGTGGTLDFDPDSLRHDMLGRTLGAFEATDVTGRRLRYEPGRNVICMLIWQLDTKPAPAQPNTPAAAPVATPAADPLTRLLRQDNGATIQPAMEPAAPAGPAGPTGFAQQAEALNALRSRLPASANVKFFGLCTNSNSDRQDVVEFVGAHEHSWPEVMAVDAEALGALRVEAMTAFVAVIDEQGTVRFAGSADGFLLPMFLKKTAGVRFVNPQAASSMMNWTGRPTYAADPNRPVVDPNLPFRPVDPNVPVRPLRPIPDPNSAVPLRPAPAPNPIRPVPAPNTVQPVQPIPAPVTTPPAQTPAAPIGEGKQYRQLSMEEEVQADKELAYARDLFMKMGQRRFTTYTQGVELCREIIRKYPGTKFADEARQLLRKVPENQRERYNITNEELGL